MDFYREDKNCPIVAEHAALKKRMYDLYHELNEVFDTRFRSHIGLCVEYLVDAHKLMYCSINLAVSLFLLELSKYCSMNFFKEAVLLLSDLLDVANREGHVYEQNMGFYSFAKPEMTYCEQRAARRLAEISAAYLSVHFGPSVEKYAVWLNSSNQTYPNLFGNTRQHLVRTTHFLELLNKWLVEYRMTDTSLQIIGLPKLEADFLLDNNVQKPQWPSWLVSHHH